MNKNIIMGVGTLIILGVIVGFFVVNKKSTLNPTMMNQQAGEMSPSPMANDNSPKSLKDLLTLGSQKCTFNAGTQSTGTVYVSSGKMKADFTISIAQGDITSHMLIDGETGYVWSDDSKGGIKMQINAVNPSATPNAKTMDVNKKYDYSCVPWTVNESFFVLPANITFSDIQTPHVMVPKTGTSVNNEDTNKCASCDTAPADYKVQCRQALGCN